MDGMELCSAFLTFVGRSKRSPPPSICRGWLVSRPALNKLFWASTYYTLLRKRYRLFIRTLTSFEIYLVMVYCTWGESGRNMKRTLDNNTVQQRSRRCRRGLDSMETQSGSTCDYYVLPEKTADVLDKKKTAVQRGANVTIYGVLTPLLHMTCTFHPSMALATAVTISASTTIVPLIQRRCCCSSPRYSLLVGLQENSSVVLNCFFPKCRGTLEISSSGVLILLQRLSQQSTETGVQKVRLKCVT